MALRIRGSPTTGATHDSTTIADIEPFRRPRRPHRAQRAARSPAPSPRRIHHHERQPEIAGQVAIERLVAEW